MIYKREIWFAGEETTGNNQFLRATKDMAFHYKLLAARNPRRTRRLACGSARKHPDHRSHPTSNMNCDIPDERCWRTYLWRFVVSVNILKSASLGILRIWRLWVDDVNTLSWEDDVKMLSWEDVINMLLYYWRDFTCKWCYRYNRGCCNRL